jgi:hypothetical protein
VTGSSLGYLGQMHAQRDPDLLLIEEMLAPPPLEDARNSLEYWQRRRKVLPLYRLAARREAKQMTVQWQETVRAAERARFEASPVGRLLAAIGISGRWVFRAQRARDVVLWIAWAFATRKLKLMVGGVAAAALIVAAAVGTVLVVLVAQLA